MGVGLVGRFACRMIRGFKGRVLVCVMDVMAMYRYSGTVV